MEEVKEILKQNNFQFKKQLGQNFLTDKNLLQAIVTDAEITSDDEVLEIGPGAGTLTQELAKVAKKVICYEIDAKLQVILEKTLKNFQNVAVFYKDILKESIQNLKANFSKPFKVVANLPYYITTPILFYLLEHDLPITSITVMVQKEVAERVVAKAGTKEYGALSVSANVLCDTKIKRIVTRELFYPVPNVDSAILHFTVHKQKFNILNMDLLQKLITSAFAMRRKTLSNNLKKSFSYTEEELQPLYERLNISSKIRGESLTISEFVNLANHMNELVKK